MTTTTSIQVGRPETSVVKEYTIETKQIYHQWSIDTDKLKFDSPLFFSTLTLESHRGRYRGTRVVRVSRVPLTTRDVLSP